MSHHSKKKAEEKLHGAGTLTVSVLQARNLAAMDSNGKSDPFCKISNSFNQQLFQTHTLKKTLDPVWNETFSLFVGELSPEHHILIKIFDRDMVGADFLGDVKISLKELVDVAEESLTKWFPVENEPDPSKTYNKGKKERGEIEIKLSFPKALGLRGAIKEENPTKYYKFVETLGAGAFAEVKKAIDRKGKEVAIKIIQKKKMNPNQKKLLEREIAIMSKLHHPNIVELIEAYDTDKNTYLVLELITGGELFDDILKRNGPYYEWEAKTVVRQICAACKYMHSVGIAHRDLKPENILLASNTATEKKIKISDFGLSGDSATQELKTSCGTAMYVAPEVLMTNGYGTECDIWSVGVITYILLSACIPFDGQTENQVFEKILSQNYRFPSPMWDNVSPDAKDFIKKIFVLDPKQRMTASMCLKHPWLAEKKLAESTPAGAKPLGGPNWKDDFQRVSASQRTLKPPKPDPRNRRGSDDDEVIDW